jgi:uncharacterized membrane protein
MLVMLLLNVLIAFISSLKPPFYHFPIVLSQTIVVVATCIMMTVDNRLKEEAGLFN